MVRALARVNLAAIERNVALLAARARPAALCAVVKGDGYGHGAVPAARAALAGGATWLAVATAQEALTLRSAGFEQPLLVMGALSDEELPAALAANAELVAWSERFVAAVLERASATVRLHVKLDTGMGRLGTRSLDEAMAVARRILAAGGRLELAGAMTHFATSDGDLEFVDTQLARFEPFVEQMRALAPGLIVHAANSAATLREPRSHHDLVRCGIAIYGADPMNGDPEDHGLEPALELSSYLAAVKRAEPGDSAGYGRRFVAEHETWIGTLPIGYADGFRRAFTNNCDVLIAGRRHPVVGAVSMDNITVDLGAQGGFEVGDRAVLIGRDGEARQTAEELARRIETINYEVLSAISDRVAREYHRDGEPAP